MALTYPLTIPSAPGWVTKSLVRVGNRSGMESPITKQETLLFRPGTHWRFTGVLPEMSRVQASPWRGFVNGLRNGAGTFELPPPDYPGPLGSAVVNGLVKGAAQTGVSLIVDGLPLSEVGYAKAGDFVQVENQCYELSQDVDTDGAGEATFELNMEIRGDGHADNATVNILTPKILMYDAESLTRIETDKMGNVHIVIAAREVVA